MKIDKTYIINMEHRTDRKENILKQLEKVNITDFIFFKGIKTTPEQMHVWNPNYLNPIPTWYRGPAEPYRLGAFGCMMSHIHIIKHAYEQNYNYILILEDDTEFLFDIPLEEKLKEYSILDKLDFGIFYFAGNNRFMGGHIIRPLMNNIYATRGTATTGSYIISRKAMKLLLDTINHYPREIDVYYMDAIQQQMPCFVLIPPIAKQITSHSDILNRTTTYNLS
jgi:GR25 family glycosyltransferase involved in LPS biosynthesis